MGGVDLLDSLLGFIETNCAQRSGTKNILPYWVLWRRKSNEYMPLFDFKLAISELLCKSGKAKKRGRSTYAASTPTSREGTPTTCRKRPRQDFPLASVRTDRVGHFPIWKKNRQLCQNDWHCL